MHVEARERRPQCAYGDIECAETVAKIGGCDERVTEREYRRTRTDRRSIDEPGWPIERLPDMKKKP
jgi:hypothetical protein